MNSKPKKTTIGEKINPVRNPQEAITDYFKIKNQPKITPKNLKKNCARITPLTDFLASQRDLADANKKLQHCRGQMLGWSQHMQTQWKQLEERQLQLRDSFLRFNHFIKENHEKRKRAEDKINKEKTIQKHRSQEMIKLQDQVQSLRTMEEELNQKIEEYQIYKDFLTKAVEETSEFTDIQEILSRYEMLAGTRTELGEKQGLALSSVQEAREKLTEAAETQAQVMMGLDTQLAKLRVRQDAAQTMVAKWDAILARTRAFAAEKAIEVQQVQSSCWDLYKTMCHQRKEPVTIPEADTEHQLTFITRRIQQMKKITAIAKEKSERHVPATNAHIQTSSLHV